MADLEVYVDASVILRILLRDPAAIAGLGKWSCAVTSELLRVEALRTLGRLYLLGELDVEQLSDCVDDLGDWLSAFDLAPITAAVLRRAGQSFPTPLGTLEAIHLATALLWMEGRSRELTLVTHDRQLALAARASGVAVQFTA